MAAELPVALADLTLFLGNKPDEVLDFLPDGERLTKLLWDHLVGEHGPDKRYDPALVERYYKHPVVQAAYLLALTEYWLRPERQNALSYYVTSLSNILPLDGKVLDWGAGTGEILVRLAWWRPDLRLYAADYSGLRNAYLRSRRGAPLILDLQPPVTNVWVNKWDAVICTSALEHVDDIEATTRMLVSWIRPGGVALFEVDWVYNQDFPMHLPITASWRDKWATELMPSLGMRHVESALWRKESV